MTNGVLVKGPDSLIHLHITSCGKIFHYDDISYKKHQACREQLSSRVFFISLIRHIAAFILTNCNPRYLKISYILKLTLDALFWVTFEFISLYVVKSFLNIEIIKHVTKLKLLFYIMKSKYRILVVKRKKLPR